MTALYHVTQLPLLSFKVCPKCGEEKLLDEFEKRADTGRYRSDCRVCRKQYLQEYQETHQEQIRSRKREYAIEHREHIREYSHEWHISHREEQAQKHREWHEVHREQVQAYLHEWYISHREEHMQYSHEYHATHKEQIRLRYQQYYALNQQDYIERANRRRSMQRGVSIGAVDYERVLERDGAWCYICEQDILPHHDLHFDHVIPITRGGNHSEDNIKPTHKACNLRKYTRLLSEMTSYQRRGL